MIFITGITGLLGSHIARMLINQSYSVSGLCRTNSSKALIKDIEHLIKWYEGDVSDVLLLGQAMQNADVVIHTAALISFANNKAKDMIKTNVEGTANVVNLALSTRVPKLIHISSIAALGRKEGLVAIDENAKWEESELNTNYAKSKYLADLEVWRAIEEGLNAYLLYPSIILGAGELSKSSTKLFSYVFNKNKMYTDGTLNYVDVNDICSAVLQLVKNDYPSKSFILNGGNCTYKHFFDKVAQEIGVKPIPYKAQPWMLAIAWRILAVISFFTGKEPLLSKETARVSSNQFLYQSDRSKQVLGIQYTSLDDTIKKCVESLRS